MSFDNSMKVTEGLYVRRFPSITTEEISEYLSNGCLGPDLVSSRHLVRVISNTGLHLNELKELQIGHIDPIRGRIEVPRVNMPDSRGRARYIPLRPKTFDSLMLLHTINGESALILGDDPMRCIRRACVPLQSAFPHGQYQETCLTLRWNLAFRLFDADVPAVLVDYCLGTNQPAWSGDGGKMWSKLNCDLLSRVLDRKVEEL